jgi:hypothetical protein
VKLVEQQNLVKQWNLVVVDNNKKGQGLACIQRILNAVGLHLHEQVNHDNEEKSEYDNQKHSRRLQQGP